MAESILNTPSLPSLTWPFYALFGAILVVIGIVYFLQDKIKSFFDRSEKPYIETDNVDNILPGKEPQIEKPIQKEKTWCFIGEDLAGRYCVEVPSAHSCDPSRTFSSRSECTMSIASALPLGIMDSFHSAMTPISTRSVNTPRPNTRSE